MNKMLYPNVGEEVYYETLDNGLGIIVVKKSGYAKKYAYFAANYGGADRNFTYDGNAVKTPMGVAHFLEHKMFDMPNGNALNALSENGASPNAYTSLDITAYHFECVDKFRENLEILLDFVSTGYFTEESVRKEQGIIGQEIGMIEDNPGSAIYFGLLKCLYAENPIRDSIAGTIESISQITADTLYKCHSVFYSPSNMALCVVGDVDPNEVVETAKRVLPKEKKPVPKGNYGTEPNMPYVSKEARRKMNIASPMFLAGIKTDIPKSGADYYRAMICAKLAVSAFMGKSSKLYSELYGGGLIKSDFEAEFETAAGASYIAFGGESRDVYGTIGKICERAAELKTVGFDGKYFSRIKKMLIGQELKMLNNFDDIAYNAAKGHFLGYDCFDATALIESVKKEECEAFAAKYFSDENIAVSIIEP